MSLEKPELLELFMTLPNDKYHEAAELPLIALGEGVVDDLLRLCDSPDPIHRWRAVWTLGKIRSPRSYDTIIRLTNDGDDAVSYDATLALGHFGDEKAIPFLRELRLKRDERSAPATEALRLLGERVRSLRKLKD